MTTARARTISRTVQHVCVALNAGFLGLDLATHSWAIAAAQSVLVALLVAWAVVTPDLNALLDARLAEAAAQQAIAERTLAEITRMQRAGELRVGLDARPHAGRMN